jgi:hypothetical protein
MIALMGRFAKLRTVMAALAVTAAGWCIAATASSGAQIEVEGPVYSQRALAQLEIHGIRLGLSRDEVGLILAAQNYRLLNPARQEGGGYWEGPEGRFFFDFIDRDGLSVVESFTYERFYSTTEMANVEARRAELLTLVGRPTQWTRWVRDSGQISDSFSYVSQRAQLEYLDTAWSCYAGDWRCDALRGDDCRPAVRHVAGIVISGYFTLSGLSVEVSDYRRRSAALRRDPAFRAQDTSGAICPIPMIH